MTLFVAMATVTKDLINSQLFSTFGIITGATISKSISHNNKSENEESAKIKTN